MSIRVLIMLLMVLMMLLMVLIIGMRIPLIPFDAQATFHFAYRIFRFAGADETGLEASVRTLVALMTAGEGEGEGEGDSAAAAAAAASESLALSGAC
jgi:hypothetical protein